MMVKQILSCDWGTTSFRLRLVNTEDGTVLDEITGGKGIAVVYNDWLQSGLPENERVSFYKSILQTHINKFSTNDLAALPLIISGMASSTIGITELPYGDLPFEIKAGNLQVRKIDGDENFKHDILLVSGLKTNTDVMRGEETMMLGCEINQEEELFIFPGTHSKHATLKNKCCFNFKTYMTGEVFDLLANKSILSKSVEKNNSDHCNPIFEAAVKQAASGNLLNNIFHVRTNQLFKNLTAAENYNYLSGLVIGAELKDIANSNKKIQLVCDKALAEFYLRALKILTPNSEINYTNSDEALVKGHCRLANLLL